MPTTEGGLDQKLNITHRSEAVQLALKSGNFGGVDFFAQALQKAGVFDFYR